MSPSEAPNYEELLLSLIGSLTLDEHMGDVANDVNTVLYRLGVEFDWDADYWNELARFLHDRGVTTLHGINLFEEEEEEEEE